MAISSALYSSRSEEWETPEQLFSQLDREFRFTLDPCATAKNAKCARFFSKEEDGLLQDWASERVFMNPPYGRRIGEWMQKAIQEADKGALVVCLVHARTDTKWWHAHVQGFADEVRFVKGRIRFQNTTGKTSCAPFPSAVVIYRAQGSSRVGSLTTGLPRLRKAVFVS
jgi:site-specific DNA-methyltransferase (adenine-specific)